MPETAIYKNNTMVFWQDNIWFSGKIFYKETETNPYCEEDYESATQVWY